MTGILRASLLQAIMLVLKFCYSGSMFKSLNMLRLRLIANRNIQTGVGILIPSGQQTVRYCSAVILKVVIVPMMEHMLPGYKRSPAVPGKATPCLITQVCLHGNLQT